MCILGFSVAPVGSVDMRSTCVSSLPLEAGVRRCVYRWTRPWSRGRQGHYPCILLGVRWVPINALIRNGDVVDEGSYMP